MTVTLVREDLQDSERMRHAAAGIDFLLRGA